MENLRKWIRLVEGDIHPDIMYHRTPRENRESIMQHGLLQRFAQASETGIFLTTKYDGSSNSDVWAVDVTGLELEPDHTDYDEEEYGHNAWWVYYDGDIPPSRLKLVS